MKTQILKTTFFLLILACVLASCKEKVTEEPSPVNPTIELELGLYIDQGICTEDCSSIELIDRKKLAIRNFNYPDVYWNYEIVKDSIILSEDIFTSTHIYWFHIINSRQFEIEWANEQFSFIRTYKK